MPSRGTARTAAMRPTPSPARKRIPGACTTCWGMSGSGARMFGWTTILRSSCGGGRLGVRPPRDPGRLVGRRRAGRARGVPRPLRALEPDQPPGLPLCRVQAGGRERSRQGSAAVTAAGAIALAGAVALGSLRVVSGGRQGSEAEGAEQPGDRDPTSAAVRPGEDDGLSAQLK